MKCTVASVLAGFVLMVGTASSAGAGAIHEFYPEDYDAHEHFATGEGFCVPWAGTFHEVRTGGYKLVLPPGGRDPGELHINGVINGLVELVPDNASLPTYSGTYREKVNGVVTESTNEGDVERVGQYRLRSTLTGTDGSTLALHLAGKVTINANGVATVSRDVFTCS
ncbi:hypothetical protein V6K52_08455 [Knoellia sp. S7-12]|uniref:hypothetical protein n=1 Tax=Knoellia sp. S7-12 TaxID=3126698 RepID=UPI00336990A4